MNNACPSCGAIYNVAAKDVGRRIKCKKCNSALVVTEDGLEVEDAADPVLVPAVVPTGDDDRRDDREEEPTPRKSRDRGRRFGGGFDPSAMIQKIGGIPSLLFGIGVFLAMFAGFMQEIGKAKVERRKGSLEEAKNELAAAERRYNEKENKKPEDDKNIEELRKSSKKAQAELQDEIADAEVSLKRSTYWDRYFQLFGFILVAFGCLGFLRSTDAMLLRVVAGIILTAMVLALFRVALGAGAGVGASVHVG